MLKKQVPANDGTMPAGARAVTVVLLVAAGLVAAALRSPAPIHAAEAAPGADQSPSNPAATAPKTLNPQSFDLTYVPANAIGFMACKPAAIAQLPACKPQLARLNALLAKEFPARMPKIEDIEQATIEYSVRARDRSKKQMGRIMPGAFMFRTVKDFDWKTAMKAIFKKFENTDLNLVEVHLDGHVYFKSAKSKFPRPFGPDSFYFPDARTVVWDYENNMRILLGNAKRTGPLFVAGDDWRKVDGGLFALAMDTRNQRWKLDVSTDAPDDLPIAPLIQQPSRWLLGIDGADSLILRAIATCETDAKGQLLARTAEVLITVGVDVRPNERTHRSVIWPISRREPGAWQTSSSRPASFIVKD